MEGKPGRDGRPNGGNGGAGAGRPKIDWAAAFNFYASLEPKVRRYQLVCEHFDIGLRSVTDHASPKRENWYARAKALDRKVNEKAQTYIIRERAKRIASTVELTDKAILKALADLDAGVLNVNLSDIPGLVKVSELLEGEATDRTDSADLQRMLTLWAIAVFPHIPAGEREVVKVKLRTFGLELEPARNGGHDGSDDD